MQASAVNAENLFSILPSQSLPLRRRLRKSSKTRSGKKSKAKAPASSGTVWGISFAVSLFVFAASAFITACFLFDVFNFLDDSGLYSGPDSLYLILGIAAGSGLIGAAGFSFRNDLPAAAGVITLISGYALVSLGILTFIYEFYGNFMWAVAAGVFAFGIVQCVLSILLLVRLKRLKIPDRPAGLLKLCLIILTAAVILLSVSVPLAAAYIDSQGRKDIVEFRDANLEITIRKSVGSSGIAV